MTRRRAPPRLRAPLLNQEKRECCRLSRRLPPRRPEQDIWVTANFKETQLADMHPGQSATVAVDAYGGRVFNAHVDSIASATGARFSLLPPENATGNYVKVVQRIPVKIVFNQGEQV